MAEQLSITTAAGTFDAIAAGPAEGRPILLLHGFPQAASCWDLPVAVLGAKGFRAVAPDQRGYSPGVRPSRPAEYAVTELVADVVAIADELGWNRFDLAGHDWGATVGWWTAAGHPDRIRSLAAVSTPHPGALSSALRSDDEQQLRSGYFTDWRNSTTERRMLENNADGLRRIFDWRIPASRIDDYVSRLSEPGALTAALNWYRAGRPGGAAEKITVPTIYIWSTDDAAFGSTAALDTANWVSGPYRFEMLEDLSHWIPDEAPETLAGLLIEHLAAH